MDDIYEEIVRIKNNGDVCALASIIRVKGSTPRPEGSKMLVRNDGTILGSIGGYLPSPSAISIPPVSWMVFSGNLCKS